MGHVRVFVEDFVLRVENLSGFLGGLVFHGSVLDSRQESLLFNDRFVLFDNVSMSSWQSLNILKVLLMSLFMDPWVDNFDFFRLELLLLLISQQGLLAFFLSAVTLNLGSSIF